MAIATIQVPSKPHMSNGLSKCLTYGIEYEMLPNMQVELTCADETRLAKIIAAFGGSVISATTRKEILPDLPRHEA